MRLVSPLLLIVALLFGISAPARAQSATADIRGLVVDPEGMVLSGAAIAVVNTATGAERNVTADAQGRFAVAALPSGPYEVTARLAGYATRRQEALQVQAGTTIPLRMELTRAALPDTLNVGGVPAVIDSARSSQGSVVTAAAVENLPLIGRNVLDLVALVPGVSRHVNTGEFSIVGQREPLNSLLVDGFDAYAPRAGRTLSGSATNRSAAFLVPIETVQEVRIDAASYSARYGYAAGGNVSVVTRSGSNRLTGSAFEFYQDDALNSNTLLAEERGLPKDSLHGNRFGGAVGGPIKRGSHFFFVGYEGARQTERDRASLLGIPGGDFLSPTGQPFAFTVARPALAGVETRQQRDSIVARTDHRFGGRQSVTVRYRGQETEARPAIPPDIAAGLSDLGPAYQRFVNVTAPSLIGASVVNELQFQYGREQERRGSIAVDRFAGFPQRDLLIGDISLLRGGESRFNRTQVADILSASRGAHVLKAGFDLQLAEIVDRTSLFAGLVPLLESSASAERRDLAAFVEDSWQIGRTMTVNAGVRYQRERFPVTGAGPFGNIIFADLLQLAQGVSADAAVVSNSNWAPRLGLAWRPEGGRVVVRGGYGIFHGRSPAAAIALEAPSRQPVITTGLRFSSPTPSPGGPILIGVFNPPVFLRTVGVDAGLESPRAQHINAGVEWEWMPYTSIAVTAMHVSADRLPRFASVGVPSLFGPLAGLFYDSIADSRYDAVNVELHRRFAQSSYYRLSYTVGRTVDTAPEFASTPGMFDDLTLAAVPGTVAADRAPASNDQRHRLVGSAVYLTNQYADGREGLMRALLREWTLSAVFRVESGQPYSAYAAGDLNRDGNPFNDIAPGTTRNQYNLPAQISLDGRLARTVHTGGGTRLTLMLEMFNVRNRPNYTAVNNIAYAVDPLSSNTLVANPLFGEKTAQANPRTMQLAARFTF